MLSISKNDQKNVGQMKCQGISSIFKLVIKEIVCGIEETVIHRYEK